MDNISSSLKKVQDFCEKRDWNQFHSPKELAIGISTEAAELLDIFRFKTEEQMKRIVSDREKRNDIEEELADVFFFLLRFAQMYDFNLLKALEKKMFINEQKYPAGIVKGNNDKYDER